MSGPPPPGRLRRLKRPALWLLASALVGAALGLALHLWTAAPTSFAEGTCVTLTDTEAQAVDCASEDAQARIVHVTQAPERCEGDAGWIRLGDDRYGCLTWLTPPEG